MKTTRTGIALLALALMTICAGSTQAQVARRGALKQARAGKMGQKAKMGGLLEQLNLTPTQKKQIMGIEIAEKQQMKAIQQNAALSATDEKTQEKAARKEGREKILAVLTPDQKTQLKQLIAQRRQQKGQTPGTPTIGTPAAPSAGVKTGATAPASGTKTVASDKETDDLDDLA